MLATVTCSLMLEWQSPCLQLKESERERERDREREMCSKARKKLKDAESIETN